MVTPEEREDPNIFIDARLGSNGNGFWFYALGPILLGGLLAYLLTLMVSSEADDMRMLLWASGAVALFFAACSVAALEGRRVVQRAELRGSLVSFTPLWGSPFTLALRDIEEVRPSRSFGYLPAVSHIDNRRKNIEVTFRDRGSVFLFGCPEADQWSALVAQESGLGDCASGK